MRPFSRTLRALSLSLSLIYVLLISLFAPVMIHGQEPGPSPSPSATVTPSPTPAESPTPTPTPTPTQQGGGLPVHGAPYAHLPNMDAMKAHPTPVTPQIIEPVPSVRCSPAQPDCVPEPAPSPSPSPTPGPGQGWIRPEGNDPAGGTGLNASAWANGPTRRLARELLTRNVPETEGPFDYLAKQAADFLRGKETRTRGTVNMPAGMPWPAKYSAERNTLSGSSASVSGRADVTLNHYAPAASRSASASRAPAPYAAPDWDDIVAALLDPINASGGTDPLSRNFHWSLGLAGLPGRAGLDAALTLNYNSLIWTKTPSGDFVVWDVDRGFPTPGFRLGFPVIYGPHINASASTDGYLLITPDGGHVELRRVGATDVYESADSAHLQLLDESTYLTLRTTDGTQMTYNAFTDGYRCSQIKDRNGNYLQISYYTSGRLRNLTDTLGRVFTVNYDEYDNPISITQARGGSTFTWATFGYDELTLNLAFDGTNAYGAEDEQVIPVLKQVGLPDGSYYTFDYNDYAQVTRVNYYAADDHLLNYLGNDLGNADGFAQTDCPRIGAVSVWAENWNLDTGSSSEPLPVTTTFSTPALADCNRSGTDDDCQETVVTAPDGTEQHTLTRIAGDWDYGLPVLEETWATDDSSPSTPIKQRWVTTTWDQDNTSVTYPLNPRVTDTYIHDSGNTKRTHIGYRSLAVGCGTSCSTDFHLPNSVVEYEADASTVYRTTETDYLESTNYLDRRIIGLPV